MAVHDHHDILLFARWGIGDLVLQWPVLESLRYSAPDARLTVVAASPAAQLLEGSGLCDQLHTYQRFGVTHVGDPARGPTEATARWLDARPLEAIVDTLAAAPAVQRAVWGRSAWSYETDAEVVSDRLRKGLPAGEALAQGVRAGWGMPVDAGAAPTPSRLMAPGRAEPPAGSGASSAGRASVALVPFASHELKRWPVDRFVGLGKVLVHEGYRLQVFSAPDTDGAAAVVAALRGSNLVEEVPPMHLRHTARRLSQADICVGNDTGLLHLAAAVGTPAVSIFGPSDPDVYAPAGRSELGVGPVSPCPFRQDRSLSPPLCWKCDRCLIRERSCVEEVTVKDVLERARRALVAVGDREAA